MKESWETQKMLVDFICDQFAAEASEIDPDKSLVDQGVIDSFGLIDICSFLDRQWRITVDPREMTRENFGSLSRIVGFVDRRRAEGPGDTEEGVI